MKEPNLHRQQFDKEHIYQHRQFDDEQAYRRHQIDDWSSMILMSIPSLSIKLLLPSTLHPP